MKIVNMPRGSGKTKMMAEWVLRNTHKRAVIVGSAQTALLLGRMEVPPENILMACNFKSFNKFDISDIDKFEEIGVDEVNQVLSKLFDQKIEMITLTANACVKPMEKLK